MGVLSILLVVCLSALASFALVVHVNQKQQKQSIMGAGMLLARELVKVNHGGSQRASELLGIPILVTNFKQANLGRIEKARLQNNQMLRSMNEGVLNLRINMQLDGQDYVLSGQFKGVRSAYIRGAFGLIRILLQANSNALNIILGQYPHLPIRVLESADSQKLAFKQSQMIAPYFDLRFNVGSKQGHFYSWVPEINRYVVMGPYGFQQGLSWLSLFVVCALAIILAGIAVYWLVHRFELSLQHLERATSRIAAGHLHSRVKVISTDAFGRLGQAFNRMAEQIQRLMGVQKEMIRAVSHELRTPVARMRFGVQMMEDTIEDKHLQKQVQDMDQDLQELDELVDEILTYARLEEGGPILEFNSANLLDLVDQVVEETRRRTDKVDIQWHSQTTQLEHIFSDIEYRYMHRAIQNLVGNACRYAKKNVFLEYSFDNGICRIDIEDDGEGIPEKDWDRVFSPFTRLDDSRTRSSGGYGLGLSIVRRIIFWHGGSAMVSRSRWGGAKMSLLWPKTHQSF